MPSESAQHPLKYSYTFHVVRRKPKGKTQAVNTSWAENIEDLGSFGTVRYRSGNLHPVDNALESALEEQTVAPNFFTISRAAVASGHLVFDQFAQHFAINSPTKHQKANLL